jgi:hypothetical protein
MALKCIGKWGWNFQKLFQYLAVIKSKRYRNKSCFNGNSKNFPELEEFPELASQIQTV